MIDFPLWGWAVFAVLLFVMLFIDLFAHRGERADSQRSAIVWSVIWIAVGLSFGGFIWWKWGAGHAGDYLAAYLIEKSLSVDNLFVFLIVFQSLNIPKQYHRKVLSWGIFGALIFRAIFIFLGAAAIERWQWVAYVFGAILIYAAIKIFRHDPAEEEENKAVAWLSRHLPVTKNLHHAHFFVVEGGRRVATPLLLAVMGLEATDIMFAIDSVPAAFSVTTSPFIIYSSNAFAILGLRALYIVLAKSLADLKYLHFGLAAVLAFAGLKLLTSRIFHIPAWASISFIVLTIGASAWASVRHRNRLKREQAATGALGVDDPGHDKDSART
ncbi:MAG: TerC family protein [Myxococcaceae bacterium]